MDTPAKDIKYVVLSLRAMGLHGLADRIVNALEAVKANNDRVVGAYMAENMRARAKLKASGRD